MRRSLILFILTLVCSSGAWAQMNFISEVKISGASSDGDTNIERLQNEGFTVIYQDLNQHEGGNDVYIGYKTTTDPTKAITGLLIMESSSSVDVRRAQYKTTPIEYRRKNYYRCDSYGSDYEDCDLNRHSGGADITLYYTKDGNTDDGGTLFTVLTAVGENKSMSGYLYTRHWKYGTDMYSTAENDVYGNTNERNGSYKIYLPYKVHTHAYTATFNWADDGHSCSVTTQCACGHSSTGDATITSKVKTPATYRVDGITTYTAKITLNNKEFTDTKDVQDIVMPLDEVKSVVKGMIDDMVANESRADMSSFGAEKKALVDAAATREDVWAIWDAFPADLDAAVALVLAQAKSDAQAVIQAALQGVTDEAILAVANTACTNIDNASSVDMVNSIKSNALAEIQRLKELGIAKADAIAAIQALVSGSTDELAISTADKYIALIGTATTMDNVTRLRSEAERFIGRLQTEPNGLTFGFVGTGNPIETQHRLEGLKMTYSEDGEDMTVTINGKAVTYPLSQVSELSYFQGTPAVELTTHENPADPGFYYTTFYSGLEAYAIPEGVKAFTAELTSEGDALIVTQIESGVLPQDEGVLLESTSADAITLEATDPATGNKAANNSFEGADVQIALPAGSIYVISAANNVMAFYKYTGFVIPANKAYIHIPDGQQAPARIIWNAHGSSTGGGITTDLNSTASAEPVEKFIQNGTLYIRKGEHVYNVQGVIVK